jgi:hypothetical protein
LLEVRKEIREVDNIEFDGKGVVVRYTFFRNREERKPQNRDNEYVAEVEVYMDGNLYEKVSLPVEENARKQELFYTYELEEGPHTMTFKWLNPEQDKHIDILNCVVYASRE